MWKANGKTTTLQLFLDSLSPKTEKLSLEGTMDLSRDRLIPEDGMLLHFIFPHQTREYLCRNTGFYLLQCVNISCHMLIPLAYSRFKLTVKV
jgi:hypothetical protein